MTNLRMTCEKEELEGKTHPGRKTQDGRTILGPRERIAALRREKERHEDLHQFDQLCDHYLVGTCDYGPICWKFHPGHQPASCPDYEQDQHQDLGNHTRDLSRPILCEQRVTATKTRCVSPQDLRHDSDGIAGNSVGEESEYTSDDEAGNPFMNRTIRRPVLGQSTFSKCRSTAVISPMKIPLHNDQSSQTGILGAHPQMKMDECSEPGLECRCKKILITLRAHMREVQDIVLHLHNAYVANATENELDSLSYFLLWRLGQIVTNQ